MWIYFWKSEHNNKNNPSAIKYIEATDSDNYDIFKLCKEWAEGDESCGDKYYFGFEISSYPPPIKRWVR